MNYQGNYCMVGHFPGCSAYYARKWGVISELKRIAPKIKLLDFQTSHLESEVTYRMVRKWIEIMGKQLTAYSVPGTLPPSWG